MNPLDGGSATKISPEFAQVILPWGKWAMGKLKFENSIPWLLWIQRTKHGPGLHGPPLRTGSMDPLWWTRSMDTFLVDCEQSLRMVTRARKARARKSSEASESRGEALGQFALSSPAELRLDWLKRDCSQSTFLVYRKVLDRVHGHSFLNNENWTKTETVQKYDLTRRCRPLI